MTVLISLGSEVIIFPLFSSLLLSVVLSSPFHTTSFSLFKTSPFILPPSSCSSHAAQPGGRVLTFQGGKGEDRQEGKEGREGIAG